MTERSRETLREKLTYFAYATISWLARALPTQAGRKLFSWAGGVAYHLAPRARTIVADNQSRVLGRPAADPLVIASTKRAFRSYARYWFDTFDIMDWPDERFERIFEFGGLEHIDKALAAGNGVIIALPHTGNWDAAGHAMTVRGTPVVTVAEHLRPERLFELFFEQRQALGMQVVGLTAEGKVGQQLAAALSNNRAVALVADRDLTGRGIQLEMFGSLRRFPIGPALLSLSTGAPVVVADVSQTTRGWRCVFNQPLEVEQTGDRREDVMAIMRRMVAAFERAIAAAPDDWHMFQPWED